MMDYLSEIFNTFFASFLIALVIVGSLLGFVIAKEVCLSNDIQPQQVAQVKKQHNIIVYAATWCPACHQAIDYLKDKGIKFTVFYVDKDSSKAHEMVRKSGESFVPQIYVDGKMVSFSELQDILGD